MCVWLCGGGGLNTRVYEVNRKGIVEKEAGGKEEVKLNSKSIIH